MKCEDLAARLTDLLEGDLEEMVEEAALEHLSTCVHCERVLAETQAVTRLAKTHGAITVDESDRSRMLDRISSQLEANDP